MARDPESGDRTPYLVASGPHRDLVPPGQRRFTTIAAALAVVLVIGFCTPFVLPNVLIGVRSNLPWFPAPPCDNPTVIEVVAAPVVRPAVQQLTTRLQGTRLNDGSCLSVRVREQEPADTVASSAVLPPSRAPQVWVSDSSMWVYRVTKWKQRVADSFGTTPVIVVSSGAAINSATNRPWTSAKPSWADVFTNARPLSLPDVEGHVQGQLALLALWQAGGEGAAADRDVAAASIAASQTTQYATEGDALSAIVNPPDTVKDTQAPFVVSTEQAMVAINQDSTRAVLTPIYPSDGSPYLDFPIVRLSEEAQNETKRQGTEMVIGALTDAAARSAASALGLRNRTGGNPPTSQRGLPAKVAAVPQSSAVELARFGTRLATLRIPSRMLVTMDVSRSMTANLPGSKLTRIEAATRAAIGVGQGLPGASSVGLWAFAVNMDGTKPYKEINPIAPLGAADGGVTHREAVIRELSGMNRRLTPGGTGLYQTVIDAMRAVRSTYDPRAGNSVVLFTDGTNENSPGLTLQQVVATLKADAAAAPDTKVRLITIGLGPQVDFQGLQAMADAAGGAAYQAQNAQELQKVLYDSMSRRS